MTSSEIRFQAAQKQARFTEALKVYMERKRLDAQDLAERLDKPVSTVRKWLAGSQRPRFQTRKRVARILDLDLQHIEGDLACVPAPTVSECFQELQQEYTRWKHDPVMAFDMGVRFAHTITAFLRRHNVFSTLTVSYKDNTIEIDTDPGDYGHYKVVLFPGEHKMFCFVTLHVNGLNPVAQFDGPVTGAAVTHLLHKAKAVYKGKESRANRRHWESRTRKFFNTV